MQWCIGSRRGRVIAAAGALTLIIVVNGIAGRVLAEPATADVPAVSTFAPADVLVSQVNEWLKQFEADLATPEEYAAKLTRVQRDAHSLAVVAAALILHDQPHELKASAGELLEGAQALAAATDYAAAKAANDRLRSPSAEKGEPLASITWDVQAAPIEPLMKQVTFIYNRLRRGVNGTRFEKQQAENARYAALLAVIGQVVSIDKTSLKEDSDAPKWRELCAAMRDEAGQVGAAVKSLDQAAAKSALERLDRSCTECHKIFRPDIQ